MYPPPTFHFRVDFTGLAQDTVDARFSEVSGLSSELGVEELAEGGENRFVHRLPARAKYGNLVLRRGLIRDSALRDWCEATRVDFRIRSVAVNVTLLNEDHQPLAAWGFVGAWPVKWSVGDFKAQDNAYAVESIELAYQYFTQMRGIPVCP